MNLSLGEKKSHDYVWTTVLRDTIFTYPLVEGLTPLLSSVAESHGVAEAVPRSAA